MNNFCTTYAISVGHSVSLTNLTQNYYIFVDIFPVYLKHDFCHEVMIHISYFLCQAVDILDAHRYDAEYAPMIRFVWLISFRTIPLHNEIAAYFYRVMAIPYHRSFVCIFYFFFAFQRLINCIFIYIYFLCVDSE